MLLCLSLSAQSAPLEVREPFAFLPEELPEIELFLRPHVAEAFLLSTCNRFEAYVVPRANLTGEALAALLAGYRRVDAGRLCSHARIYRDFEATEHLFRVAAGLESQVLGEAQILGQIRRSLEAAQATGLLGHRLATLVRHALTAGRRVRQETALSRGALSVPGAVVEQARREIGDLAKRTVVLVGAGETAQLATKALDRVGRLVVVNRTLARAKALAGQHQGEALPWAMLPAALAEADLVIGCTGARQPAISYDLVAAAQQCRGERPLLLVDLAVPRAVEPTVTALPNVRLITLADLRVRSATSQADRQREVPKAEAILAEEIERAWGAWQGAEAHDAVATLRQWAEQMREDAVDRTLRRLRDLPPEQGEVVALLTRSIVNKLLHQPTIWLKTHPNLADVAVRDLFGVEAIP